MLTSVGKRRPVGYILARVVLILLVLLTLAPFLILINMSLRSSLMIRMDFFSPPNPIKWANFAKAFAFISHPVLNSLLICFVSLFFLLIMVSLSGYAFGRMQFRGKNFLFMALLAVMMIPGSLLIIPQYRIITDMGVLNTYWALILPYIASQQVGIVLARTYYASLPQEMFDSAQMDGANAFQCFLYIGLPLSRPILITVGITTFIGWYNDYIWPTVVLTTGDQMKTFCQIVFNNAGGNGTTDMGMLAAAFIIGTLPLLIITLSCMKYYLQGMLEGTVKG